jgi:Fur family ferric uptake transcriptional regulator
MPQTDEITELLRERGHRVTRPRRAVWDVLTRAEGHLTVEEIAARVEGEEPGVNVASVYRSLALFSELSLVRESRLGDQEASRWEVAHPDEHFHLVCEGCGRIDHHVGTLVESVREHLRRGHGFTPRDIELTVTGTCADCEVHPPAPAEGTGR